MTDSDVCFMGFAHSSITIVSLSEKIGRMNSKLLRASFATCVGAGIAALGISEPGLMRKMVLAEESNDERHKILIIGGGTAGTTVANQISRKVTFVIRIVIYRFK